MASTEAERAEFKRWMEPVTHVYSKGMATPQEPAVSKASLRFDGFFIRVFLFQAWLRALSGRGDNSASHRGYLQPLDVAMSVL